MNPSFSRVGTAMWHLQAFDSVSSTNDIARELPAWTAVTARSQTAGRGRFGRAFVSEEGGLWISAVLPAEDGPSRWNGFSLMVGNHLREMLHGLGLADARLRWPNDLMIGSKKLGGLLIEQGRHETLTVGLGLNVRNTPWQHTPELETITTRLADQLPDSPEATDLIIPVLDALADAHEAMLATGLAQAIGIFNAHHQPGPVEITRPNGSPTRGTFTGLDPTGNLILIKATGTSLIVPHTEVERLQEKSTS